MNKASTFEFSLDLSKFVFLETGRSGFIHGKYLDLYVFRSQIQDKDVQILDFDVDVLEGLSHDDVEIICVWDIDQTMGYETTLLNFQKNGIPFIHPKYGPCLSLPLSFWKIETMESNEK